MHLPAAITMTALNRPISESFNRIAFNLSANSNMESVRNLALEYAHTDSLRNTWPLSVTMLLHCKGKRVKQNLGQYQPKNGEKIACTYTHSVCTQKKKKKTMLTSESNMHAKRTRSTSKTPALSRVTWSSWASNPKPGIRLANSTTPRMAGENRFEKSFNSSCCPVTGRGLGFKGQAC